jgi:hypothetical protein
MQGDFAIGKKEIRYKMPVNLHLKWYFDSAIEIETTQHSGQTEDQKLWIVIKRMSLTRVPANSNVDHSGLVANLRSIGIASCIALHTSSMWLHCGCLEACAAIIPSRDKPRAISSLLSLWEGRCPAVSGASVNFG